MKLKIRFRVFKSYSFVASSLILVALPLMKELPKQLCQDNKELQRTRGLFFLMFLLRGIPFVDLAYLKKHDIDGNVMTYRRRKTGRLLTVTLVPEAMKLIKRYMNTDPASPYLFSLITSGEGTEAAYKEYQLALRNFNYQLMILKQVLGLTSEVSSYTARHTWATMAYYCEVHPGVISEAMGHSSITVTETYLKPFKNKKIDEANVAVISSLKKVYSVECDKYSVLGKIINVMEMQNSRTKEIFYYLSVECNSIQIEFTIAKEDLMGEPKVGRRFKGILWLQGEVDCL